MVSFATKDSQHRTRGKSLLLINSYHRHKQYSKIFKRHRFSCAPRAHEDLCLLRAFGVLSVLMVGLQASFPPKLRSRFVVGSHRWARTLPHYVVLLLGFRISVPFLLCSGSYNNVCLSQCEPALLMFSLIKLKFKPFCVAFVCSSRQTIAEDRKPLYILIYYVSDQLLQSCSVCIWFPFFRHYYTWH